MFQIQTFGLFAHKGVQLYFSPEGGSRLVVPRLIWEYKPDHPALPIPGMPGVAPILPATATGVEVVDFSELESRLLGVLTNGPMNDSAIFLVADAMAKASAAIDFPGLYT